MKETFDFGGGFIVGALVTLIVASITLPSPRSVQIEAVKRGVAEWAVDAEGNTKFKWKE